METNGKGNQVNLILVIMKYLFLSFLSFFSSSLHALFSLFLLLCKREREGGSHILNSFSFLPSSGHSFASMGKIPLLLTTGESEKENLMKKWQVGKKAMKSNWSHYEAIQSNCLDTFWNFFDTFRWKKDLSSWNKRERERGRWGRDGLHPCTISFCYAMKCVTLSVS